jgi:hypothetical protein
MKEEKKYCRRRKSDISISVDFHSSEHLKRILKFSRVNKCFPPHRNVCYVYKKRRRGS